MKLFSSLLLLLLMVVGDVGQTSAARKFDEFGDAQLSDIAARLDNFAIQLQNEPQTKGFVIAYRSRRDLPGLSASLVEWLRNYLVSDRGFPADRIIAIDGGAANCVSQELWLVPPGSAPTIRNDVYPRNFDDATLHKFYEAIYSARDFDPESYSFDIRNSFAGFAEALHRRPKAIAYLVAYAGVREEERGEYNDNGIKIRHKVKRIVQPSTSARQELTREKQYLVSHHQIAPARIITMFGGYRDAPIMELWIGPPGGRAPIATPTVFFSTRR